MLDLLDDNVFAVDGNVNELDRLIAEELNDPLQRGFACFGIGRPNKVTGFFVVLAVEFGLSPLTKMQVAYC